MIAILDYGMGNLFSIRNALHALGAESSVCADEKGLEEARGIILPGVGAFEDAMLRLKGKGLDKALRRQADAGKPLLGICLGMQLLFKESLEFGRHEGLGLMEGSVVPLRGYIPDYLKIPHIGWNALHLVKPGHPMLRYTKEGDYVYFVHSFHASLCPDVSASCEYGKEITACAAKYNIWGCQFHPEKSGQAGQGILRAFCEEAV